MPAGLLQMVGETGWQLSQGERGRLYIARTLLQGADCLLLAERFTVLTPETLHQVLQCVLERAPILLVIAHPCGVSGRPLPVFLPPMAPSRHGGLSSAPPGYQSDIIRAILSHIREITGHDGQ